MTLTVAADAGLVTIEAEPLMLRTQGLTQPAIAVVVERAGL